ncbi:HET-domain-containing protein [Glonium stellatum]|uniref:HET-domain-containing protein n=1 Tax=Glonium stellatum TaxID=574774 RepID=A0A8E2JM45_9PEZI|nr:HET-domain-containing protein [Glonium stellatum]
MVVYKHKPLKRNTIRILTILPGRDKDEIRCRVAQRENEEYEALSWCWGTTPETATIQILADDRAQDATMLIKPNLERALRRLRLPKDERILWVDAICIDQADRHERNMQVAMMSEIYERAEKVDVWLGDEEHDSQMALDFIKNEIADLDRFDELVKSKNTVSTDKWRALTALLTREWFERRWVVQEIALGKKAELYCGKGSVLWTDFTIAVAMFESRSKPLAELYKASPSHDYNPNFLGDVEALGATRLVHVISNLLRRSDTGQISERRLNLEQLVANLATFQAREPHDMIYAVLALAKDTHRRTRASDTDTSRKNSINYDTTSTPTENNVRMLSNNKASRGKAAQKRKASSLSDAQETGGLTVASPPRKKARSPVGTASSPTSPRVGATTRSQSSALDDQELPPKPELGVGTIKNIGKPVLQNQKPTTETNSTNQTADPLSGRQKQLVKTAVSKLQERLQPERHRVFNVDYDQPFFNVCKQFLDFTLPKTKDLDILCRPWAPEPSSHGEKFSLPSWVPSLSGVAFGKKRSRDAAGGFKMVRKNSDPLVGPAGFGTQYYNASNLQAHSDSWRFGVENTETERSLFVTGYILDEIDVIGPASQMGNLPKQWMNIAGWKYDTDPSEELWRTLVADRGPNGQNCPEYYPRACAHAGRRSTVGEGIETGEFIRHGRCSILTEFVERVRCVVWNRRLIRSKRLRMLGLVPDSAENTDLIFIIHGCSVPVVLRKKVTNQIQHYVFLGECYLHGMMDGQAPNLNLPTIKDIELR